MHKSAQVPEIELARRSAVPIALAALLLFLSAARVIHAAPTGLTPQSLVSRALEARSREAPESSSLKVEELEGVGAALAELNLDTPVVGLDLLGTKAAPRLTLDLHSVRNPEQAVESAMEILAKRLLPTTTLGAIRSSTAYDGRRILVAPIEISGIPVRGLVIEATFRATAGTAVVRVPLLASPSLSLGALVNARNASMPREVRLPGLRRDNANDGSLKPLTVGVDWPVPTLVFIQHLGQFTPAWEFILSTGGYYLDTVSGEVLQSFSTVLNDTTSGTGKVYLHDAFQDNLTPQTVTIPSLTSPGTDLEGPTAEVCDVFADDLLFFVCYGTVNSLAGTDFGYTPDTLHFSSVMAYYHGDKLRTFVRSVGAAQPTPFTINDMFSGRLRFLGKLCTT